MTRYCCAVCFAQRSRWSRVCRVCGAQLRPVLLPKDLQQASATQIDYRMWLVPSVALVFAVWVLGSFSHLLHRFAHEPLGVAMIMLLLVGICCSEQAWFNGRLWAGLRGMVLWGGLAALVASDKMLPWGVVLLVVCLVWWLGAHSSTLALKRLGRPNLGTHQANH